MGAEAVILVTFAVYLLALLLIGWWADRRYSGSYEGFATAGKSLGGGVAAVSSAASSESAWVMLGVSGLGYAKGLAAYWTAVGCVIGFACTSLFVVVQLRRDSEGMDVLTLGDYLERVVADPRHTIRIVSALVIAFFMSVYVVAQFMGTGKQMVGMGLMSYQQGVVLAAVIIGIYVLIGGYAAVCWTDALQGLLMMVVMVALPVLALVKAGGWGPVLEGLGPELGSFWVGGQGLNSAALGFAISQLGIGLGYPGMPHSIIRFVTVRDHRAAKNAAAIQVVWSVLVLTGSVTLGVAGRVLLPELSDPEHILPALAATHLHPVLGGVILAAVTAAIMSTADSQLMMSATALVHDLWRPLFGGRGVTGRGLVIRTRVVIMLTSMAAMGMALLKPRVIYTFVLFAWGALGAAFTPVILLSLHWKRLSWQGALASFLLGPVTVVIWKLAGLSETLYELIPAALISTVAAVLVSRATAKPD